MVFDANGLRYRYTVVASGPHVPVGPATVMAGRLIVPVTDGVDVFDPMTGAGERHIPLQRPPTRNPRWCRRWPGPTLLEQRGGELVALGAALRPPGRTWPAPCPISSV